MFTKINTLQPATEYYQSLTDFIYKESMAGNISLKKALTVTLIHNLVNLIVLVTGLTFTSEMYNFILLDTYAGISNTIGAAGLLTLSITALINCPRGLVKTISSIDAIFDRNALNRLIACGAPEDVTDQLLRDLRRNGTLSYTQVHDIYWICSRMATGINPRCLLEERYCQITERKLISERGIF